MLSRVRGHAAIALAAALTIAAASAIAVGDDHKHVDAPNPKAAAHDAAPSVSADDAVKMLADGNARFVSGAPNRPNLTPARLCDTFANGQHPYAAVLSCADSRVPVEHVLDAGIGDLFVVRVAGNVSDVDEIGTLEYGVEHLGINAVLVLGHTKCGAVTAVIDHAHVTPNIAKLVDNIVPAAEAARKEFPQLSGPRLVSQAIRLNVQRSMADLVANSDVIRERVKSGKLKIVGGVYNLHTGEIDWIGQSSGAPTSISNSSVSHEKTAKPQAAKVDASHDKHAPAHAEKISPAKHDNHDAKHDSHKEGEKRADDKETAAAKPEKKDNLYVLGGMLAGSSILSFAAIHFIGGRSRAATPPRVTPVESSETAAPKAA